MDLLSLKVEPATHRGLGTLEVRGYVHGRGELEVEYRFPENGDLASPGGDYELRASLSGEPVQLTDELDEWFRVALPRRLDSVTPLRARRAAEVLIPPA